jgi:hypothetical protein
LLDFAVMIKDTSASTPIYPLAVVQDNDEAKEKIQLTNKMLEKAVIHAAATESPVQVVTRIDLNVSDGITRATKELLISDVILGWTDRTSTTDRWLGNIFGTTLDNVLQRVWETVYVCNFHSPLNTTKKMVLVMPPNAEYELGFLHYLQKMFMLAKQAGARLLVFCSAKTQVITEAFAEQSKMSVDLTFRQFDTIEDFLILAREITRDDLVVVVTARKSTLSYHAYMEGIPAKLERHFKDNNVILLYPEQREFESLESGLQPEDLTLAPIQEQIANLNKLGKAVKRIFKK